MQKAEKNLGKMFIRSVDLRSYDLRLDHYERKKVEVVSH